MKKMFKLFSICILLLVSSACNKNKEDEVIISPDPIIQDVTGEQLSPGSVIQITGTGFGSNDSDIEWLGGTDGNIEQGEAGVVLNKDKWSISSNNGGFTSPVYDNTIAHSGSKSIKCSINSNDAGENKWGSGFTYNNETQISKVYATWWVYIDPAEGEGGQWKMWRLRPNSNVSDTEGEIMSSSWYEADCSHKQQYIMLYGDEPYSNSYPDANDALRWLSDSDAPEVRQWTRMEVFAEESTGTGDRNGSLIYNIHKQTETVKNTTNWERNIITRTNIPDRWQYFVFQNYWGNDNADNANIWIDDIYIQVGSRARVELCDSENWESRTHCEIQEPISWASGTLQIKLNKASFQTGDTAYLFVINEAGNVSNGFEIVIGE